MLLRILLFTLVLMLGLSCQRNNSIRNPVPNPNTQFNQYDMLEGDWRLTSFSAFMSIAETEEMPDFSVEKVVFSFSRRDNKLIVKRKGDLGKHDYSLPAGEYMIWANRSMIKIGQSLYMYHADKNKLILDSNYDPSYGPDGIVFYFDRL